MPFTNTWDAAFEATPADTEDINLGALRIRQGKVAVRERMQIDHVWEDGENDGRHNKLTLPPQPATPATDSPNGFLYTITFASNTELYYKDSSGNQVQLTFAGGIAPTVGDFSVGLDLFVGQNLVVQGVTSFMTSLVPDMSAYATPAGDRVFALSANTYFEYFIGTGQVHLVINGVTAQIWP